MKTLFQYERHGYFRANYKGCAAGKAVFNKITGLKDSRGK